jgi:RNA-binding protein 23/39
MNGAEFWGKRIEMEAQTVDQETGVQITLASSLGPTKLLVNQLHYAITQDMIREIFAIYGEVEGVELQLDEVGMSTGTALVQYKSAEACRVACEETNGIEVAGRPLRVSIITESRSDNSMMTPSMSMQMAPMPYESERLEEEGHVKTAQQRAQLIARLQSAESSHNMSQLTGIGSQVVLPLPTTTGQVSTIGGYVPQSATGVLGVPSPCIVLKNMFNPAEETSPDFDVEIAQDVSEECSQYGRVLHVHVDKNSLGFVYLRFETAQAAVQAGQALHGRWFAGRMVSAEYIPPVVYEAQFLTSRVR